MSGMLCRFELWRTPAPLFGPDIGLRSAKFPADRVIEDHTQVNYHDVNPGDPPGEESKPPAQTPFSRLDILLVTPSIGPGVGEMSLADSSGTSDQLFGSRGGSHPLGRFTDQQETYGPKVVEQLVGYIITPPLKLLSI
jgi:hypothetical protein